MSLPISGFTAVPNPQMLAFMGAQSFIMMQMAGAGWQYGKRKISAMKNEEFNALTVNSLLQKEVADVRQAIPTIIQSMNDMTPMVSEIVKQYGDFILAAVNALVPVAKTLTGTGGQPAPLAEFGKSIGDYLIGTPETNIPMNIQGAATSIGESTSTFSEALKTRHYNDIVLKMKQSIKNMSYDVTQATLTQLPFMGLKSVDFKELSKLLLAKANPSITTTKKTLPSSTNILQKSRVSKQTLRNQRTLLIKEIQRLKNSWPQFGFRGARTGQDRAKLAAHQKLYEDAQQKLANFLDRWKGVKY